ncbi:SpoIIE family protein phosphatase [Iamia sp. SCSIO 61187]|uniref:SpoIIE family protein phosphatase n=1 Tax=Iamia sp. SCSIO 61187 TaxID=2722752 RepID=UPI001C6352B8|nr:SpoIIE family protein phosphatase [Iamia sp. SCSIO 61187]QYG92596.1 SpoIIE family protein phosphatase [Iamia sp. SCSIO 61187]
MVLGSQAPGDAIAGSTVDPSALAAKVAMTFAAEPDSIGSTQRLLELVVEAFSDWGTIHLVQPDGTMARAAAHHRDRALAPLVERLMAAPSIDPRVVDDMAEPLATRRAAVRQRTVAELTEMAPSPEVLEIWTQLGFASGVLLPLVAGDRAVGVLALMSAHVDHFTPAAVTALESLAAECALLAETARLARQAEAEQGERIRVRAVLDSLLAHAPVATVVVDTERRVLHHNEALRDVAGLPEGAADTSTAEPGSRPLVTLEQLVPSLAPALEHLVRRALADSKAGDPAEIRTGDPGRRRYWQVSAFPIRRVDDVLFGAGVIFVEVTDERLASRRQRESLARLDLTLDAGGMGTWDWDLVTGRVIWSPRMEAIAGLEPGTFGQTGADVMATIADEDRDSARAALTHAAQTGTEYEDEFRLRMPNGELRWVESRGRVVATRDGTPLRMIGVATDVTERHVMEDVKLRLLEREHAARLAAEASRERLALLAEVSGALASTLDPKSVHETLAALLVPRLADWCTLDALDEDGGLRDMAVVHIDPRKAPLVAEIKERRRQAGGDGIWSVRRAMRTGRSERIEDITDDDLAGVAVDDDHLATLRALGPRSALVAPLVSRGRVLGGITLVTTGSRPYDADDQNLLENIASRAATAIDTAVLFDSRTEVARALQQTLLPPALPEIPGIDLWADYRVAEAGIEIGGDFYDVFETTDGWNVVLGDVCGKGPAAAAVTGLFRHTLRAVAPGLGSEGPATVLTATNDAILDQIDDSRFATAVLVSLHPGRGRAEAAVACGGHPRPVVLRADGSVERVDATGTLLGVLPSPPLQEVDVTLHAGDALVLYTDGVTEARNGPEQFGESRLMAALEGATGLTSAREVTARVLTAVDAFRDPESAADDIAVVAVRVPSMHDAPGSDLVDDGPAFIDAPPDTGNRCV